MIWGSADLLERNGDRSGRMGILIEPGVARIHQDGFAILHETVGIRWRDAADGLQGLAGDDRFVQGKARPSCVCREGVAIVSSCRFWFLYEDRRRIARWEGEHRSLVDQKVETFPLCLR